MKKSILATAVALSAGLFASVAMAALPPVTVDGSTVNFSGNLIPAACEVSVASQNMVVDLGTIDLALINATTSSSYLAGNFDINFENCDSAIATTMDIAFTTTTTAVNGYVATNEAIDSPSNAGLTIQNSGGTQIPLSGSINSGSRVTITDGAVVSSYTASYIEAVTTSNLANITAGNTLYNMTYKVIYQ